LKFGSIVAGYGTSFIDIKLRVKDINILSWYPIDLLVYTEFLIKNHIGMCFAAKK